MARIWNKYPYTDFHELNLSWVIDKITDFEARLTDVEEDVADLKTRMTSVEGRMTTAEERIARHDSDIAGLSSAVGGIRDRVTTLENADIQGAAMLESVSSVEAGNASVTVNFSAAAYNDGEKTAGTDSAVIPAATSNAAGVMLPAQKKKLDIFNVVDGNAEFSGRVSGSMPSGDNDFATKAYIDDIVITGESAAYSESMYYFQVDADPSRVHADIDLYGNFMFRYGLMRVYSMDPVMEITEAVPNGGLIARFYMPNTDDHSPTAPNYFVPMMDWDNDEQIGAARINCQFQNGYLLIENMSGRTLQVGEKITVDCYGTYIVRPQT